MNMKLYDMERRLADIWESKYDALHIKWNKLVDRVNAKGGEDFLKNGTLGGVEPLSLFELRELRILCHPDKHYNNSRATKMTQQLNSMIRTLEGK